MKLLPPLIFALPSKHKWRVRSPALVRGITNYWVGIDATLPMVNTEYETCTRSGLLGSFFLAYCGGRHTLQGS